MQTVEEMNANVGEFVLKSSATSDPRERSIDTLCGVLDSIDAVPEHLLKSERDKKDARSLAVAHYVSQRLAEKYPLVSPELLERKRWVGLTVRRGHSWTFEGEMLSPPDETSEKHKDKDGVWWRHWQEIPLLIYSQHAEKRFNTSLNGYGEHRIVAKRPEVPDKAEVCRNKATADVFEIAADLLRNERVSRTISTMLRGDYRSDIREPEYSVAWVPLLDELRVQSVPPDPALLLDFHGYTHLVTHWDRPGERPIESILREYTSGSVFPDSLDDDDY